MFRCVFLTIGIRFFVIRGQKYRNDSRTRSDVENLPAAVDLRELREHHGVRSVAESVLFLNDHEAVLKEVVDVLSRPDFDPGVPGLLSRLPRSVCQDYHKTKKRSVSRKRKYNPRPAEIRPAAVPAILMIFSFVRMFCMLFADVPAVYFEKKAGSSRKKGCLPA